MSESSPEFVRTSTAAAMTLKYYPGKFYRGAKLKALNLLLTYDPGCYARCAYCGLSSSRKPDEDSFIRVDWPTMRTDEVIERANKYGKGLDRVCISMITHPKALKDLNVVSKRFRDETKLSISALIGPTLIKSKKPLLEMKRAGVDRVGIAVDAATPGLFEKYRGRGVRGPHKWVRYWKVLEDSVAVFGKGMVGVHLIVGLGETERQMVETIQKAHDMGGCTHLFSFYPEDGSALEKLARPAVGHYHRVQLARWLIDNGIGSIRKMKFNRKGQITDFGVERKALDRIIDGGEAFMTSGCPGKDGKVSCNRPYGNERPSEKLRNYPFLPNPKDVLEIRKHLADYSS